MANIDFVIDTEPMAQEMSSISNHIKGTTAAVVAMQTAVVLAEQKAADLVCDNVNKGFYAMMRSQISQKIATLQSKVDSYLMQLNVQRKQLLTVKNRMERDYNMISNRYLKLFNGLNQNLKQRIFELDKPTIDFAVRETEKVSNRSKYLAATVPISQLESLEKSQKIIASNVKYRGSKVIDSIKNFLTSSSEQEKLTDTILFEKISDNTISFKVPILINECNYDKYGTKSLDIIVNKELLTPQAQTFVKNIIGQQIASFQWQNETEADKEIKNEFGKLISASTASNRVKDLTNKLFANNSFQTLKNQQL